MRDRHPPQERPLASQERQLELADDPAQNGEPPPGARGALHAVVEAACQATGSAHGALVVFDDGRVADVVYSDQGRSELETLEAVIDLPGGGAKAAHPSTGAAAPTVLLDIPIVVSGEVLATLFLTGSHSGRLISGAAVEAARALAAASGAVLSCERRLALEAARARGLEAAAWVAQRLAAPGAPGALKVIAEEAWRAGGGIRAAVVVGQVLAAVESEDGSGVEWHVGQRTEVLGSAVAAAVSARRATVVDGTATVPLASGCDGAVVVAGRRGPADDNDPLTGLALVALRAFAPGATAALQLATARSADAKPAG